MDDLVEKVCERDWLIDIFLPPSFPLGLSEQDSQIGYFLTFKANLQNAFYLTWFIDLGDSSIS